MLKKALSLVLSVFLILSCSLVFAAEFSDVTSAFSWAEDSIITLAKQEVITGYPDGTFKPGKNITKEEAIALFARILGASEAMNESVVSLSNVLYEDELSQYNTYAKEAAAYLMYKKVLTEADLSTYLSASNKGESLKRYEAATLIAKCLGGDVWLKTNPDATLTYTDASSVPAASKGYVYFATAAQIMQGMENNMFVPLGNVTRAQVAVMLHRMFSSLEYSYLKGVITEVNPTTSVFSVKNKNGEIESYKVDAHVAIMIDGVQSKLADLPVGQEIIITFSDGGLYSLDVVEIAVDDSFEAIYKGKLTDTSGTEVRFADIESGEISSYKLADNAVIIYNGKSAVLDAISVNDYAKVSVESGKVKLLEAETRTKSISDARVESISFDPDVLIALKLSDGSIESYSVKSGATIRRNGSITTFSDLVVGDKVDVTLEYGKISTVTAIGIEKTVTGSIDEIKISKSGSSLKVNIAGNVSEYSLSRDATIKLDNAAATIYDLRLGYQVELKTSSATVTSIVVKSVASPLQITGQVTLVNTTYNMLRVSYADVNGDIQEAQVFVKDTAKILDSNDGKIKALKNILVGQNVTVAGSDNLGVFEATSIMILSNAK